MSQKEKERRALCVSIIANFSFTAAGIWIFYLTNIQALFLDCFFSFVAFLSSIAAFIISKASKRKTKHYPDGLHFLEPLYAILKSILTLSLLIFSVYSTAITAWNYFFNGVGEAMNTSPVLPYTIAMVTMCFSLAFYNHWQNHKINGTSTILKAESKTNFVDGLQSLGIGVAVVLLSFIDINGSLGFLHYTGDFFITTILALFSLKEPVQVIISAFRELSGGTTDDKELEKTICASLNRNLKTEKINLKKYKISKTGMYISVFIYLSNIAEMGSYTTIFREKIYKELKEKYENIEIVLCES